MKLLKSTITIQYIAFIYAVLYILFIFSGSFGGENPSLSNEVIGVYFLFILFIIALSVSWSYKIITGILFLLWNVGIWFIELFFVEKDGGFGIISGIPLIILGVFFILKGIEDSRGKPLNLSEKSKIALQLFIGIYTVLYLIVIINDVSGNLKIDFYETPGIILISLIIVYSIGFILSWIKELIAGIIFIFWFIGVFYVFNSDPLIGDSGPWAYAGFVILLQGSFYINYHLKFKTKNTQN